MTAMLALGCLAVECTHGWLSASLAVTVLLEAVSLVLAAPPLGCVHRRFDNGDGNGDGRYW